ncbi:hypothetical protein L6452_33730 [Arctium lappa]|uniref:Uncharacterized protein n=1 Tax=Arctium lappa TaxID=4217 RepID=A0ACB8YHD4_ARCLA|nr:hypothetical protein L6452_33730 [Arctium lappa]
MWTPTCCYGLALLSCFSFHDIIRKLYELARNGVVTTRCSSQMIFLLHSAQNIAVNMKFTCESSISVVYHPEDLVILIDSTLQNLIMIVPHPHYSHFCGTPPTVIKMTFLKQVVDGQKLVLAVKASLLTC